MLVVLLVLLTATTLAATSLQTTQFELRSAGYNRAALQTQYVSEAAAMTTFSWLDALALDGTSFNRYIAAWNGGNAPAMNVFGEPEVPTTNRANANRTQWVNQQSALLPVNIAPITVAGYSNGSSFTDPVGTFGPKSVYVPGVQARDGSASATALNYVVDMYDCRQLPNAAAVGFQINQTGSGSLRQMQWYCVVTSRGRSYVPYAGGSAPQPDKVWATGSGPSGGNYVVNRFSMAHDSRGTIVTPPIAMAP